MSRYLLDTNHVGVAVDATTDLAVRITESQRRGNRVGTCLPVLCEIPAGRMQVSHPQEYQRDLDGLLKQIRIWPMDEETTEIYGRLHALLRRRGRVLSAVDLMAAALAEQHGFTILTTDRDFEAIHDVVSVENWLAQSK
ncbi:MAG TPA: type II toxin-antitoxin system VapC family toxin [Planctomycetaceae bacterium]|nr:type II toxin-antitoxin system VapC family toxin [Planctomycetaceae bacterium]